MPPGMTAEAMAKMKPKKPPINPSGVSRISMRYNDVSSTPLVGVEVKRGTQEMNLELLSDKRASARK